MNPNSQGKANRAIILKVLRQYSSQPLSAGDVSKITTINSTSARVHLYNLVREKLVIETQQVRHFGKNKIPRWVNFYQLSQN